MTSSPPASNSPFADGTHRSAAYLRLCGLGPVAAREHAQENPGVLQERLDAWAADLVSAEEGETASRRQARGRAQLLLSRAPALWPAHFLRTPPCPELTAAIQSVALESKRPLRQTGMTPQPIDLGPVSEVAEETWKTFDTWPVLRGLTVWLLFSILLGMVFYVVRF